MNDKPEISVFPSLLTSSLLTGQHVLHDLKEQLGPLSQHLLKLGIFHHLFVHFHFLYAELEKLRLPEPLGGDKDLGNLLCLGLGLRLI